MPMISDPMQVTGALNNAIQETADELLVELKRIIDEKIYQSGHGSWTNGWEGGEGRTGEFANVWDVVSAGLAGAVASAEISPQGSISYTEPFSHGSYLAGGALSVEDLANIIQAGYGDTGIGFPAVEARPFWDEFQEYVNANLHTIFQKNCLMNGLPISGGTGIGASWG